MSPFPRMRPFVSRLIALTLLVEACAQKPVYDPSKIKSAQKDSGDASAAGMENQSENETASGENESMAEAPKDPAGETVVKDPAPPVIVAVPAPAPVPVLVVSETDPKDSTESTPATPKPTPIPAPKGTLVSGGCGESRPTGYFSIPSLWVNGVWSELKGAPLVNAGYYAGNITLSGTSMSISGSQNEGVWKDGAWIPNTAPSPVYYGSTSYMKDGVKIPYASFVSNDTSQPFKVKAFYIAGTDVYVVLGNDTVHYFIKNSQILNKFVNPPDTSETIRIVNVNGVVTPYIFYGPLNYETKATVYSLEGAKTYTIDTIPLRHDMGDFVFVGSKLYALITRVRHPNEVYSYEPTYLRDGVTKAAPSLAGYSEVNIWHMKVIDGNVYYIGSYGNNGKGTRAGWFKNDTFTEVKCPGSLTPSVSDFVFNP